MDITETIVQELNRLADPEKKKVLQRFFKTDPGQYGEGDIFLGVTVPKIRQVVKKHASKISLPETVQLLQNQHHEIRMCALLILVQKYQKGTNEIKKQIYDIFLQNTNYINNWDLVDVTIPCVVGDYLYNQPQHITKIILQQLATSNNLWERRIAVISTFHFIRQDRFGETLEISQMLLNDEHDLIHKVVGWMLREVGKRNQEVEEQFLRRNYKNMPRTMLRYAIERFEETKRQAYLQGEIK